jgi:hypothetical protein
MTAYSWVKAVIIHCVATGVICPIAGSAILKADSHIACRAHAVPLPCRATKGLECVFPFWCTQCGRVWFTLAMPCPCYAPTMPFFSRPRHRMAIERWPVGHLPMFGFFRLPRGVPRRLSSDAGGQCETKHRLSWTRKWVVAAHYLKRRSVTLLD